MRHFLTLADVDAETLWSLLRRSRTMKEAHRRGTEEPLLQGRSLAMVFQKASLRTRVSFEEAMSDLGGRAIYLSPDEIKLGQRESVADVARVLSRYVDVIMARVFGQRDVELLAEHASVPVINGLSDWSHPCQGLADLFTLWEAEGEVQGVSLAYLGDGNNVCHSLLLGGSKLGLDLRVATPEGYQPDQRVVAMARQAAAGSGGSVRLTHDPREAVAGARLVYTDAWASMGQEAQAAERRRVFRPYQLNRGLLEVAGPQARVMHCLPAHRGEEITDEVMDSDRALVFEQAENRLHAQKALLVELLAPSRVEE